MLDYGGGDGPVEQNGNGWDRSIEGFPLVGWG